MLEEGGHERSFINLSGGEQMVAALSVRLALLKQLSDIRVAFFDEPTVNMDAERRERLAQQSGRCDTSTSSSSSPTTTPSRRRSITSSPSPARRNKRWGLKGEAVMEVISDE